MGRSCVVVQHVRTFMSFSSASLARCASVSAAAAIGIADRLSKTLPLGGLRPPRQSHHSNKGETTQKVA